MKDFYDTWLLSRQFDFDSATLKEAIRLTFEKRGTTLPEQVEAFGASFIDTKKSQWGAFHRRLDQSHVPESFDQVVKQVEMFLDPIIKSILTESEITSSWIAPVGDSGEMNRVYRPKSVFILINLVGCFPGNPSSTSYM